MEQITYLELPWSSSSQKLGCFVSHLPTFSVVGEESRMKALKQPNISVDLISKYRQGTMSDASMWRASHARFCLS